MSRRKAPKLTAQRMDALLLQGLWQDRDGTLRAYQPEEMVRMGYEKQMSATSGFWTGYWAKVD